MNTRLIVEQKITPMANRYAVFSVDESGNKSDLVAFAQQKRLAFKEKVSFYSDENRKQEIFSFRAEKIADIHGRFFVEDNDGKRIGAFKKQFAKSLLNSTWDILDKNDKPRITINESNQTLALLRRFIGFVPIVGEILELLTNFFKYHFSFRDEKGNEVGKYQKIKLFRDHYALHFEDDSWEKNDWRVLAAVAVALDALQSR